MLSTQLTNLQGRDTDSTVAKSFFETHGYWIVENLLNGQLLAELKAQGTAIARAYGGGTKVWHERVLFRRPAFRELIQYQPLQEMAKTLLGPDVQLLAMDLKHTEPGASGVAWHRDVRFICNKTLSMNTAIYLNDVTEEMGALRVLPGSHRREEEIDAPKSHHPDQVTVPVKAGTAVFFDAGLYHAADDNHSGNERLAVFPYFGRYFIKRMDQHFTQPLPAALQQTEDPMLKQLLGLQLQDERFNYNGDNPGYNSMRGEPGIDSADGNQG